LQFDSQDFATLLVTLCMHGERPTPDEKQKLDEESVSTFITLNQH